ncbi:MAG: hypothetical protein NVS2B3_13240 [Vulcanimicrobiaceae bacterium]
MPEEEPIVAVFDSKAMALRTVAELVAAEYTDLWLGTVRGENDEGETLVADDAGEERPLHHVLAERGSPDERAHRFDSIVPPGSAVISLRVHARVDHAVRIIELSGGHIEES